MAQPKKDIFSDLDLAFIPHPATSQVVRKRDRDAVKQSVKSLILTNYYERPFKSDIGCSIRQHLFELFTPATKQNMERAIREVIKNYEPRAEIIDVFVEDYPERNALTASLAFMVKNDPTPVVLDLLLERVR
jgi:phage baseplate assembly protein W